MKLIGGKVKLRAVEPSDVNILYKWENDPEIWKLSNTVAPFSKQVLELYIAQAQLDIYSTKQLRLIICNVKNNPVGCIDLFDFDPINLRAGVGILVANKKDRKKGYAAEALELLIGYCFDILGLHQLYCNISRENTASMKLFKKQKFSLVGIKKEWTKNGKRFGDEHLFQLINK